MYAKEVRNPYVKKEKHMRERKLPFAIKYIYINIKN